MSIVKTSAIAAFVDTSSTSTPTWSRIRKQNELNINYDAQVEENTFVDEDGPTSEVERYAVSFDGEYVAYKDDPIFEFLDNLRQTRATGTDAETEVLLVNKYDSTGSGNSTAYSAEKSSAVITITEFGGEGGGGKAHINYTVNLNGDPTRGTCTISDGVPTFTASA